MKDEREPVRHRRHGRIARLTLNRSERLHAFTRETPPALEDAVKRAEEDDEVHVIVLDGAGRAFCSSYDLDEYATAPGPNPGFQDVYVSASPARASQG